MLLVLKDVNLKLSGLGDIDPSLKGRIGKLVLFEANTAPHFTELCSSAF
jgi:hypothetical protein